jgi:hypothetical protein
MTDQNFDLSSDYFLALNPEILLLAEFCPSPFSLPRHGLLASLVSSLCLWPNVLCTTSLYFPQTELPEDKETVFQRSGKS